jgi:hypothetical protein
MTTKTIEHLFEIGDRVIFPQKPGHGAEDVTPGFIEEIRIELQFMREMPEPGVDDELNPRVAQSDFGFDYSTTASGVVARKVRYLVRIGNDPKPEKNEYREFSERVLKPYR